MPNKGPPRPLFVSDLKRTAPPMVRGLDPRYDKRGVGGGVHWQWRIQGGGGGGGGGVGGVRTPPSDSMMKKLVKAIITLITINKVIGPRARV